MGITVVQANLEDMEPGGPIYGRESALAHEYCKGVGIELGAAAHNPFNLPGSINVAPFSDDPDHVDYNDFLMYRHEQVRLCGSYAQVDLVGEADAIPVDSSSQDYVISSHVIEHLPDLISAFLEWNRVLKPGGVIFMIVPKRNAASIDAYRPITPLQHFVEDYFRKRTIWTHAVDEGHDIRGHYHVFTLESLLELIQWCDQNLNLAWKIEAVEETDSKVGNGHTVVCRYLPGKAQVFGSIVTPFSQRFTPPFAKTRVKQLVKASYQIPSTEGPVSFLRQLIKWLRGERRYFSR